MAGRVGFEAGTPSPPITLNVGMSPDELAMLLPPKARQRLETLSLKREDAHRLVPEGEAVRALGAEKFNAERALQKLLAHAADGGHSLHEDDLRVVVAKRNLAKLAAEVAAVSERYTSRGRAFQAIARCHSDVMVWIRDGRPAGTELEDAPEPKLNGKAPLLDQLENVRRRGRELAADLNRIRSSCYPSAHCKEKAAAEIEALAQRGRVGVSRLIKHDGSLAWPTQQTQVNVYNTGQPAIGFCEVPDPAIFAFANKDALLAAVFREIDAESDDQNSLGHSERQVRESEVLADALQNDRVEAALMFRGWADGLPILPRPDLAPSAWLNVQLVTVAADERRGSSPQHQSWDVIGGRRR